MILNAEKKLGQRMKSSTKSIIMVYIVLILLLFIAEIISPGFLGLGHMESVLRQAAFLGIVAIGQTFVILTGYIDISVAAVISLSNVIAAQVMDGQDSNVFMMILIVLAIGMVIGLANGIGVIFLRIPSMVMTLGIGSVVQGITLVYCKGAPKGHAAPLVEFLSMGKIGGVVPAILLLWFILSVVAVVVLRLTTYGRNIYAIGTNITAAKYSGLNIVGKTISVFMVSGTMAAVTGLLLVGYTGTSFVTSGDVYLMNSIAAVVVGGTSIVGGYGGYIGTIAGAIIMTVIGSILTIIDMPVSGRQIAQGLIVILLVLIYGRQASKRK